MNTYFPIVCIPKRIKDLVYNKTISIRPCDSKHRLKRYEEKQHSHITIQQYIPQPREPEKPKEPDKLNIISAGILLGIFFVLLF